MSGTVDYSTLSGPSSTLIPSGGELTPQQVQRVRDNVGDYARDLRHRLGLTGDQRNDVADELLQMLGVVPTPPIDYGW